MPPNTRDAYERALRQLHEWLADSEHEADDAGIAAYLGHLFQIGRAPATAAMVVGRLPRAPLTTSPQSSPPPTDRERMDAVGNPSASPPDAALLTRPSPLYCFRVRYDAPRLLHCSGAT